MTDPNAAQDGQSERTEQAPAPNFLIERSPIIVGAVGAVVALVSLLGLPWQFFVIANAALGWLGMALAVLAMSSIARGRNNARAIVSLAAGIGVFAFWTIAPETIGALPAFAYIVTAVVYVGLGLLIGRMDPARQRSVYIACAGAVVFTFVTAAPRLGI